MSKLNHELNGICAAVTGGTKGIGRAIVKSLVGKGANVAFQGRDVQTGHELMSDCEELPGTALFVAGNVSSFEDAQSLVNTAHSNWGKLDVYVSSGGPREPAPQLFTDMPSPSES